jgi:hypothetical protein
MLVVRVEIWPRGDARALRQIEVLTIGNVGLAGRPENGYEARHGGDLAGFSTVRAMGLWRLATGLLGKVRRTAFSGAPGETGLVVTDPGAT